jgi:hypothetical protein
MLPHSGQSSLVFVIVTEGSSNDALSIWHTDGCSNPQLLHFTINGIMIFLPSPIYTQLEINLLKAEINS